MKIYGLPISIIMKEILANTIMSIPSLSKVRTSNPRTSNRDILTEAQKLYAQSQFFLDSAGDLHDKTVIEIGPGDSIGLAPLFISAGAKKYICVDRFLGDIYGDRSRSLYHELSLLCNDFRSDWTEFVETHRMPIEAAANIGVKGDVIVSFNVLEHVLDIEKTISSMSAMLNQNGKMIHRVDYGPHGVWLNSEDPLDFLSVPDLLWALMGYHRGMPNRVRHDELINILNKNELITQDRITDEYGSSVMAAEILCVQQGEPQMGKPFVLST